MIGQIIAHYKILEKLGSGGMGEVYLADDTKLHRKVALKFLPESLSKDPEARERLLREARAASKLSHSNIVTIYAVEHEADRDFIAMEYVDGRSLDIYMREQSRTLDEILRLGVQMGRALEHAHKLGVVHRDLKPANIFIDREDRVRILDFGLALMEGVAKLTQDGSTMGTIAYMSPEQVQGKDADERSDVFSLGILLYEMLAGHAPFSGDHHAALMYAIMNEQPEAVTEKRPDTPVGLAAIIDRALQKDPRKRYQSSTDMVTDLRHERNLRTSSPSQPSVAATPVKRAIPRFAIPAAVVTVLAVILMVLQPWKLEVSPIQDAEAVADRLAIMYFDNLVNPDDPERYGEIATNLLIADLSESQHMQIVSSQRLYDILKLLGREGQKSIDRDIASQVAAKAKARWMLMGTILQTEPTLVITSQVVESQSGNTVASQTIESSDGESIFELVGRLAQEVATDLSIPVPADVGQTMTLEATSSTDAYRHYLNAIDYKRQFYLVEAQRELKKAIAIDSTFAMAYFELFRGAGGSAEEMDHWLTQAQKYSDRLGRRDRLFLESFVIAQDKGWKAQTAMLEQLQREFPDDIEIMFTLSTRLRDFDRHEEAIALLQEIIALDSTNGVAYNQLAYSYDDIGDFEQSLNAINTYIKLSPEEANPYDSRGDLYANHGRFEDAKRSYARAVTINPNFMISMAKLGLLHVLTRDFNKAESCFNAMIAHSDRVIRSRGRGLLHTIHSHQGRFRKALDVLDDALATDRLEQFTGWPYIEKLYDRMFLLAGLNARTLERTTAQQAYAATTALVPRAADWILGYWANVEEQLGHRRTADSLIAVLHGVATSIDSSVIDAYYLAQLWLGMTRHDLDGVRAYVDSALSYRQLEDWDYFGKSVLVRAYLHLSQPANAIPIIEELLIQFDEDASREAYSLITLHYDLARAYEMSGWTEKAIERYEHFLGLWHDADPELAVVDSARARVAALKQGTS